MCAPVSWATSLSAAFCALVSDTGVMLKMPLLFFAFSPTLPSVMEPFLTLAMTVPSGCGPRATKSERTTALPLDWSALDWSALPCCWPGGAEPFLPSPGGPKPPEARADTSPSRSSSWSYR